MTRLVIEGKSAKKVRWRLFAYYDDEFWVRTEGDPAHPIPAAIWGHVNRFIPKYLSVLRDRRLQYDNIRYTTEKVVG